MGSRSEPDPNSSIEKLVPSLYSCWKEGFTRSQIITDTLAGMLVGIVAIPLALAFAVASGVKPEQGLYTAIVAGFFIAALGGSKTQVSGPTGAFIVVIATIVQTHGYDGLATATFLAGGMLVLLGFFRIGRILRFIPYPLTVGFTTGIAVIIFSSQVKDFLGLSIATVPPQFIDKWQLYFEKIGTFNPMAVLLGVVCLLALFLIRSKKIPTPLLVLLGATWATEFYGLEVETLGDRFGVIVSTLPALTFPDLSISHVREVFQPAITIALLGAIESLLSASVADGMTGTRHRPNIELIAQGTGNMLSPLFMGIPATGAIARTATNIKSGAQTPLAAMIHAAVILVVMVMCGSYAQMIPLSALAAILIYVAWNMSEARTFISLLRAPKGDALLLITTFLLTVFIDLTVAIEVGVILSAIIFMKRMENVADFSWLKPDQGDISLRNPHPREPIPPGVEIFSLEGPLFFGAIDRFRSALDAMRSRPRVLILRMKYVSVIDASGLQAMKELVRNAKKKGLIILLSGLRPSLRSIVNASGLTEEVGRENFCEGTQGALERARRLLS